MGYYQRQIDTELEAVYLAAELDDAAARQGEIDEAMWDDLLTAQEAEDAEAEDLHEGCDHWAGDCSVTDSYRQMRARHLAEREAMARSWT